MNDDSAKTVKNYIFYDFTKITAALPGLIWYRPRYLYESEKARKHHKGGLMVIANHNGFADPILLIAGVWYRRLHFMALRHFFDHPKSGWIFWQFHCIPVDRGNFRLTSFRTVSELLKSGKAVAMFPEGSIKDEKDVAAFKNGAVFMAFAGHVPILPVYLEKRKHWYQRQQIVIGEAVDLNALFGEHPSMQQLDQAAGLLHDQEIKLMQISQKRRNQLWKSH